ncbi:M50 family metallopeptidase (plasmid) [Paraclostridium ghonii]|uniref:M50 family metallopeptidase n=1 Tax=Paraclostridium ghonii TaxID=29358 RepID=UPI00202D00C1|nr:M50 family metallopeptidase [Paeniclostridium ghonii]MCM0166569.1 M50 family metallopeptidase [Paeniclostridium ghonii]
MENLINPKVVNDISCYELFNKKSGNIYSIGSKTLDRYFEVNEDLKKPILKAMQYFDGSYSLDEIDKLLKEKEHFALNVNHFYNLLKTTGLLENETENIVDKSEYEKYSLKILQMDISKRERFFEKFSFMIPIIFITTLILIPLSIYNIINNLGYFVDVNSFKINGSSILGFLSVATIFFLSILLHECAHGVVARKYGLIPKNLNIALYLYVSPMVYLKIPGLYTLKEKQRIKVWSAGMYMNLFISLLSFSILGALKGLSFKLIFICGYINLMLIFMNICPFLPLDGYFILSTILKLPNLRKKSFKEFIKFINRKNNNLTFIYFIYFFTSITVMSLLVLSQVVIIYKNFTLGYKINHSILSALWEVKIYILLLILGIVFKVKHAISYVKRIDS